MGTEEAMHTGKVIYEACRVRIVTGTTLALFSTMPDTNEQPSNPNFTAESQNKQTKFSLPYQTR